MKKTLKFCLFDVIVDNEWFVGGVGESENIVAIFNGTLIAK